MRTLQGLLKQKIFELNKGLASMAEVDSSMNEKVANLANKYIAFAAYTNTIKILSLTEFYNSQFNDSEMREFEENARKRAKYYEDRIVEELKESFFY